MEEQNVGEKVAKVEERGKEVEEEKSGGGREEELEEQEERGGKIGSRRRRKIQLGPAMMLF